MNTKKCDRCGKHYDDIKGFGTSDYYGYKVFKDCYTYDKTEIELCLDCKKDLVQWLKGVGAEDKDKSICKDFLSSVEAQAKELGIRNLFVVADNYSITRNDNSEAIKRCRETLKDYEKEIGCDPTEDWREDNENNNSVQHS